MTLLAVVVPSLELPTTNGQWSVVLVDEHNSLQWICFDYVLSHNISVTRPLTLKHHEDPSRTRVGKSAERA
jgi:hypothetical protein